MTAIYFSTLHTHGVLCDEQSMSIFVYIHVTLELYQPSD